MKLNAKTIAGLTLSDGKDDDVKWDDELPRFGLRLRRSGKHVSKTWIAQYRINGKRGKATFGDARIVPVSKAREAARKHLAEVSLGYDPQAERAAKRRAAELTFAKVAAAYLENCRPRLRLNTFKKVQLYLTRPHYFEPLHAKGVSEVTFTDVAACIRTIENTRSSIVANAARNALFTFFSWALAEGLLGKNPVNPVSGTRTPQGSIPRDRVFSNDELVAFWRATADDWTESDERRDSSPRRYHTTLRNSYQNNWRNFCSALRLMLLLGARSGEITGMAWSEFDFAAKTWTLPKERSKNKRPLTLTLPKAALDILAAQPRRPGDAYVFGPRPGGLLLSDRLKSALNRRLDDQVAHWTPHDLRRSAATRMADIGVMPHIIEAALNHYSGHRAGISGTYNRSKYDREVAAALVRWSEHLLALVEGRAGDNVIPTRGAS
jgi:integrase